MCWWAICSSPAGLLAHTPPARWELYLFASSLRWLERIRIVTYVIAQPCIGVKDASCVDVCPVDCIHAREEDEQYFIDPDECIDCGACEPACPVTAIFEEGAVPAQWKSFTKLNATYFRK